MGNKLGNWIKKLKAGDQSAFLPLYEKTSPGLFRFLMWKTNGNRELSEDIMQESFVKFLVNLDQIESLETLSVQSYLLRIVKNCLIDKVARAPEGSKNQAPLEEVQHFMMTNATQETAVEMRELAIAMASLNEKDSEIIWMRDALGLSHREVADQVGITEQASRQAYVRAKKTLLEGFKETLSPELGGAYVPSMS